MTKEKGQEDRHLLDQSVQDLQALFQSHAAHLIPSKEHALFYVCRLVGETLGLTFKHPRDSDEYSEEGLQRLCMRSQIFYRRVKLQEGWWSSHAFPFVAFYGPEQEPVALLPASSGGYYMIHSYRQQKVKVDRQTASQLLPYAYVFYRQLSAPRLTIGRLWSFIIKYRSLKWLSFLFLGLGGTLASLSIPIVTQVLFDQVIPHRNEFLLVEISLAGLLLAVATLALNFGRESLLLWLQSMTDHDLEMALWQRLIQAPISFFRRHSLYDLYTFINAIGLIRRLLDSRMIVIIFNAVFALAYFFMMFYYNRYLALVAAAVVGAGLLVMIVSFFLGARYARQLLDRRIQANTHMLEMIYALTKVRLAGVEARLFHRWERAFAQMARTQFGLLSFQMKVDGFQVFWSSVGSWLIYFFVLLLILQQQAGASIGFLTVGHFLAFLSAFGLFSYAFVQLAQNLLNKIEAVPLWEKIKTFTALEPEETTSKADPGPLQGEIRLDHVTFGYQKDVPPIVQGISLKIRPGERVAFVGPSGSGKTTLLRLILGFESLQQGAIYYDNKDIKGLNLQELRQQLGVVLQSGALFDGTILDNINSGRYYSPQEVEEALHLIGADFFIKDLPMGIQTVVTNGGMALSGGQRQLILLARAAVGKPKILILDEATSALDNQIQKAIFEHLSRLPMTQLIVAQRLDAIQHVDRIYVIDKGHLVDQGTFAELGRKPGLFADLLAKQYT